MFVCFSCGEDATVRLFDLREISKCHKTCCKDNILILSPIPVTAMALSPISFNYIAVGRYVNRCFIRMNIWMRPTNNWIFLVPTRTSVSTIVAIYRTWIFHLLVAQLISIQFLWKHLPYPHMRIDHFVLHPWHTAPMKVNCWSVTHRIICIYSMQRKR